MNDLGILNELFPRHLVDGGREEGFELALEKQRREFDRELVSMRRWKDEHRIQRGGL
jgi:hypothetical protein